jgi:hypothetical protein
MILVCISGVYGGFRYVRGVSMGGFRMIFGGLGQGLVGFR